MSFSDHMFSDHMLSWRASRAIFQIIFFHGEPVGSFRIIFFHDEPVASFQIIFFHGEPVAIFKIIYFHMASQWRLDLHPIHGMSDS